MKTLLTRLTSSKRLVLLFQRNQNQPLFGFWMLTGWLTPWLASVMIFSGSFYSTKFKKFKKLHFLLIWWRKFEIFTRMRWWFTMCVTYCWFMMVPGHNANLFAHATSFANGVLTRSCHVCLFVLVECNRRLFDVVRRLKFLSLCPASAWSSLVCADRPASTTNWSCAVNRRPLWNEPALSWMWQIVETSAK